MTLYKKIYNCLGQLKARVIALIQTGWNLILLSVLILSQPKTSSADVVKYNVVTDEFYGLNAERILLVAEEVSADKTVVMTGKCKSRGETELFLENDPVNARERWFVLSGNDSNEADLQICLTGNLPAWFEKLSLIQ